MAKPPEKLFIETPQDPLCQVDGATVRLSRAMTLARTDLRRLRLRKDEVEDCLAAALEDAWANREARGGLRLDLADLRRVASRCKAAKQRKHEGLPPVTHEFRGHPCFSELYGDTDPVWVASDEPGPLELAEDSDARAALTKAVRYSPEYPTTKMRAYEVLANAPHRPPRHNRDATTRARRLLRKVYLALFGEPGA